MRYKNPKNFSLIEKTVTIATVLKNVLKYGSFFLAFISILFFEFYKYNNRMKKFFYRATENDTLFSIAQKFNIPVTLLVKLNNLKTEVESGDLLYIEKEDCLLYNVKPFDTASSLALKFNTTEQKILSDNGVDYLFYGLIIKI
ncbi:MAG: LysM peptidoglycan-binding domain-containing protein [Clostridiales bacterium]|nr:LysM peptidoglycan-binding domain-containing protein [Clostridiales bacterium]